MGNLPWFSEKPRRSGWGFYPKQGLVTLPRFPHPCWLLQGYQWPDQGVSLLQCFFGYRASFYWSPKKNWQGCLYRCWSWARYPSPHCGSGSTRTQSAATVGGPRFFTSIPWGIAAVFGIILLVPKEELAGVSLQVLILGPLSVSALWVRKHPDTKCRDGWRASVLYLDSLGYCCRFCAKQIKDYKQPGRAVLKRPWNQHQSLERAWKLLKIN